ncbi:MAG: hypothetical protein L0Y72_23120 [Gemmataceae bacterium]|nr:hypothetical protein [Gemmataceae bacterium]MCI0741936.1 hypothetical protein [Gemmataceae bacterium]
MDPKSEYQKLIESARRHHGIGEWTALIALIFIALIMLYVSIDIYRKGLRITSSKTITGTPANVMAILLAVLTVAAVLYGLLVWPGLPRVS